MAARSSPPSPPTGYSTLEAVPISHYDLGRSRDRIHDPNHNGLRTSTSQQPDHEGLEATIKQHPHRSDYEGLQTSYGDGNDTMHTTMRPDYEGLQKSFGDGDHANRARLGAFKSLNAETMGGLCIPPPKKCLVLPTLTSYEAAEGLK